MTSEKSTKTAIRQFLLRSDAIQLGSDGIWYSKDKRPISYPAQGNDLCFDVEDRSFWFRHRNECIVEMVRKFPPRDRGHILDVGGGNGFVSKGLMEAGWDVVVIEPGSTGARNAKKRGLEHVVCADLEAISFSPNSMQAIGAFDVIEHIEDDVRFLRNLYDLLEPEGMLYLTVPAYRFLWSETDKDGGHFRRYCFESLEGLCEKTGFSVQFTTGIFLWLIIPILLLRAFPYRLKVGRKKKVTDHRKAAQDHALPSFLTRIVEKWNSWECSKIKQGTRIPLGASLLIAARKI